MCKYEYCLAFPETLVKLWKRFHGEGLLPDEEVNAAWEALRKFVFSVIRGNFSFEKLDDEKLNDYASEFLIDLMKGRCPSDIVSQSIFVRRFRKYSVEKWNPCSKEVYDVISSAIRGMIKKGELMRSDTERNIQRDTLFWMSGYDPEDIATSKHCEQCYLKMPMYGREVRNWNASGKRMILPKEAIELIRNFLTLVGTKYSVRMADIIACALTKTRNLISPFEVQFNEECTGGQEISSQQELTSGFIDEETEVEKRQRWEANRFHRLGEYENGDESSPLDVSQDESSEVTETAEEKPFCEYQREYLARTTAERIWKKIGEMGELDLFVGYTIPKMQGSKVAMKDFGVTTSNADYRNRKILNVIKGELEAIITEENGEMDINDPVALMTMDFLFEKIGKMQS